MSLLDRLNKTETPVVKKDRAAISGEVMDEIVGFGPLEPLLSDSTVSEIMVNGPRQIYVERSDGINVNKPIYVNGDICFNTPQVITGSGIIIASWLP